MEDEARQSAAEMDRSSENNEQRLEQIQACKNKQRGVLSALTKSKNSLTELMSNSDNLGEVKQKSERFNELFSSYSERFNALMVLLHESEKEEEIVRFKTKVTPFLNFKTELIEWVTSTENQIYKQLDNESVRPKSSTSKRSSTKSSASATSSRVRERAKLAELLVEKEMQERKQAIEAEQKRMELDMEIAKARARAEIYEESSTRSYSSSRHRQDVIKLKDRGADTFQQVASTECKPEGEYAVSTDDHVDFDYRAANLNSCSHVSKLQPSMPTDILHQSHNKREPSANNRNGSSNCPHQYVAPKSSLNERRHSALETNDAHVIYNNENIGHQQPNHHDNWQNHRPRKTCHSMTEQFLYHPEIPDNPRQILDPKTQEFQPLSSTAPSSTRASDLLLQQMIAAMHLPTPEVPKFCGEVTEYALFIRAFDTRIVPFATTDADKLYYLEQLLEGEAKDCVGGCLYMKPEEGYNKARILLEKEYGDPFKVSTAYVNKLLDWPPIKRDISSSLKKLSVYLTKCVNAMTDIHYMNVLNYIPNIQTIILKLPMYLQNKWKDNVNKIRKRNDIPTFVDLCNFIKEAEDIANDPAFGTDALQEHDSRIKQSTLKQKTNTFSTIIDDSPTATAAQSNPSTSLKCAFCEHCHDVEECEAFTKMTLNDRKTCLKNKGICFACLTPGHISKVCTNKRTCNVCNKKHPTSLHDPTFNMQRISTQPEGKESDEPEVTGNASVSHSDIVLQAILPVRLNLSNSRSIMTYAFLDNGSTGCFITEHLKDQLNATSDEVTLKLRTMNGVDYVKTAVIKDLVITDIHGNHPITIPKTYTRKEIPATHDQIPKPDMLKQWPHLQELANRMTDYYPTLDIGILIGNNCPKAMQPLKVIPAEGEGPFAVCYRHGWTINGPYRVSIRSDEISCNRILFREVESMKESVLPADILRMMELDFSEKDVGKTPGERGYSQEDEQFMRIAKEKIRFIKGHYELPLPFRNPQSPLPNNRSQALKRALWQRKKMAADVKYHSDYNQFMTKILSKGYAYKIPSDELKTEPGRVRYLPHHGVYHPQKGKIRVVFDCSAKYDGSSLNDMLLPGPDLTNSLVGVLCRFRQESVAFMADIESMFYQVKVPTHQHDYLRFFWWPDGDLSRDIEEYRMAVHIFGASSSPSITNFALKYAADKVEKKYSSVVAHTIRYNFYVDDCLKSVPDVKCAIKLIDELSIACQEEGFHLTKFTSNSVKVIETIPPEERTSEVQELDLDANSTPVERALGMQWNITSDTFGFSTKLKEKPITRRGMLSTVSSIYDPLGLISPFILPAKKLLQELCRMDIVWDDEIPDDYKTRWLRWLDEVPLIANFRINRCLKPATFGEIDTSEIHIFSDASEYAYGSVAYIRFTNTKGQIHTSLLMGKARLAPLKTITIPRLELTAACVSVNLGQQLLKELDIKIHNVFYYTDSTTVLHYINNKTKRFPVFVANRISLIHDFTTPGQWRYVNTKINPADCASRGLDGQQIHTNSIWLNGPEFLHKPEVDWPEQPIHFEGEAASFTTGIDQAEEQHAMHSVSTLIEYYSSWMKLLRAAVIYKKFFNFIMKKAHIEVSQLKKISVKEITEAETAIIRYVQKKSFEKDINILIDSSVEMQDERGRACTTKLPKSSSIYKLDPFIDTENGLLRVGGRLVRMECSDVAKHPALLPYRSHVTRLIIRGIHENTGHIGRNHVMSQLREKYWVIHANSAVRAVLSKCITCKRLRAPVVKQKMADLPKERVTPTAPFTHTGVDYFGPFIIKEKRKELKRYGVVFTCLASRAIHIETANSLDTGSFIQALRRFIARRGQVRELRSDNGTNFKGAERELREALLEFDQASINDYLLNHSVTWSFNPPAASHMGGVWERLIRTVRNVLSPLMREFGERLDDESFRTLLCEVEAIVNSRPLTPLSTDPDDLSPLTPSHILTLKSQVVTAPPGLFQKEDVYTRRRWRAAQYISNVFWTRWRKEYLITLQERQKWNTKERNLKIGDIVLIKEDNVCRNSWSMGRVCQTEEDKAGYVRSVVLKTQYSELRRPVTKLVLLIANDEL